MPRIVSVWLPRWPILRFLAAQAPVNPIDPRRPFVLSVDCSGGPRIAALVKSMTLPEFEAKFDQHDIRCELEGETEKFEVKLQIQPKVTFKEGKAVKASLNWGKIEAPKLAKTALWSATAADNSFGVLQSTIVEDINDFIQTKCLEVKGEWQGK